MGAAEHLVLASSSSALPTSLRQLIAAMIAKSPAVRPQTCREVAEQLAQWADADALHRWLHDESTPNNSNDSVPSVVTSQKMPSISSVGLHRVQRGIASLVCIFESKEIISQHVRMIEDSVNNLAKYNDKAESGYFMIDIASARSLGVLPIAYDSQEVFVSYDYSDYLALRDEEVTELDADDAEEDEEEGSMDADDEEMSESDSDEEDEEDTDELNLSLLSTSTRPMRDG